MLGYIFVVKAFRCNHKRRHIMFIY